jgi:NADH dehydrogenase/NADH:ubiquinone oxidoreductase subunit G
MKITINGNSIIAEEGITILEAARRAEIHIPTLCFVNGRNAEVPCELCCRGDQRTSPRDSGAFL